MLSHMPRSYTFSTAAKLHTRSKLSTFATDFIRLGRFLGGCPSRVRMRMCLLSNGHVVRGSSASGVVSGGVGIGKLEEEECAELRVCACVEDIERCSCIVSSLRWPKNTTPSAMSSRQSAHFPLSF